MANRFSFIWYIYSYTTVLMCIWIWQTQDPRMHGAVVGVIYCDPAFIHRIAFSSIWLCVLFSSVCKCFFFFCASWNN